MSIKNNNEKLVLVFKTNVNELNELGLLESLFNKLFGNAHWNFDLEDIDKILRIEHSFISSAQIMNLLKEFGFDCEELK